MCLLDGVLEYWFLLVSFVRFIYRINDSRVYYWGFRLIDASRLLIGTPGTGVAAAALWHILEHGGNFRLRFYCDTVSYNEEKEFGRTMQIGMATLRQSSGTRYIVLLFGFYGWPNCYLE